MGTTFQIEVWKRLEWRNGEYGYEEFWSGGSYLGAVANFIRARRLGYGCVTLHWR